MCSLYATAQSYGVCDRTHLIDSMAPKDCYCKVKTDQYTPVNVVIAMVCLWFVHGIFNDESSQ